MRSSICWMSTTASLACSGTVMPVRAGADKPSGGRLFGRLLDRECAGHNRATADGGFDRHLAAMQLDERLDDRQAQSGAAMAGAVRMGLEPVEHAPNHVGRDSGAVIGHRKHDRIVAPFG